MIPIVSIPGSILPTPQNWSEDHCFLRSLRLHRDEDMVLDKLKANVRMYVLAWVVVVVSVVVVVCGWDGCATVLVCAAAPASPIPPPPPPTPTGRFATSTPAFSSISRGKTRQVAEESRPNTFRWVRTYRHTYIRKSVRVQVGGVTRMWHLCMDTNVIRACWACDNHVMVM